MPTLTPAQIAAYASSAGLSGTALEIAVAIALGESGGKTDAVGDTALQNATWGPSIGLWQIRSLRAQSGTGQSRDASRLKDPKFNAQSMMEISGGGKNWKPWSVYTSGAYIRHLDAARKAAKSAPNGGSKSDDKAANPPATAGGLDGIAQFGNALTDPNTWHRVMYVVGGGLLIIIALMQMTGASQTVGGATKLAADIAIMKGKGTMAKVAAASKVVES